MLHIFVWRDRPFPQSIYTLDSTYESRTAHGDIQLDINDNHLKMSIQGFSPDEIVKITSDARTVACTYGESLDSPRIIVTFYWFYSKATALTLVVYDSFTLFRQEVSSWLMTRIGEDSLIFTGWSELPRSITFTGAQPHQRMFCELSTKHSSRPSKSLIKWIYILVKLVGLIIFLYVH